MFTIFTTEDILCQFSRAEEMSIWHKILFTQKQIVISRDPNNEYAEDTDYVIQQLENSQIEVYTETEYINNISTKPETVLDEPSAAFILDITPQKAAEIQDKYGVICQSVDEIDASLLTREISSISVTEGDEDVSWSDLLSDLSDFPINSLLIVDRYLFSYESIHKSGVDDGLGNIREILDQLLPKQLDCDFHVLIIFDSSQIEKKYDFTKIVTSVNKLKKSLNRPYVVNIEVLSMTSNCRLYEITHDRKIFSPYFKINIPHLSKVFRKGLGEGVCSQDVTLQFLYSGAVRLKKNLQSLPFKGINKDLSDFRKALSFARKAENNYQYGINGDCRHSVSECKNRLITTE